MSDPREGEAMPAWEDARVQTVYRLLCSADAPPIEEHWEGWVARRIVGALCQLAAPPGLDEAWRTSSVGLLFRETAPGVVTGLDRKSGVEYESVTFYRPVTQQPPAQGG